MADYRSIICQRGSVLNTPSIASAATALANNDARSTFLIQNLGQNPLFVLLGSGASTSLFNVILKGGTSNDDGLGGTYSMEAGIVYTGIITIAGTSPRYVVTEI